MTIFRYTALKEGKTLVSGRIEAYDPQEARKKVREMGLIPTLIVDPDANSNKKVKGKTVKFGTLSLKEKIDFTSTLEILTSTGIPIIEALLFIEQNSDSNKVRKITAEFRKQIIAGATLGETLERYRSVFGRVFIGLVKAGEDSGELDKTLGRMLDLLKKQDSTKSRVIGALIYPAIVVFLAVVAVFVMLVFVFPAFKEMFEGMGKELPMITKLCMATGDFIRNYWFICLFLGFVLFVGASSLYTNPYSRRILDKLVLRVPFLSSMIAFSNFSNFVAVLQVAYEAGIPIVDCLFLANLTMDNHQLKSSIMQAATKVQQGTHLSVALKNVHVVPTMVTFMIATGEQSGRLGDSLHHCISYIDKNLDEKIETFTKIIEPVLMIFIGILVCFLGLALYMPLFQAYQQ